MPQQFTDSKDHRFTITVTLGKQRKIRDAHALDIMDQEYWSRLGNSVFERMELVQLLVADQIESFGMSQDDWDLALQGKGICNALSDALFGELELFYQAYDQTALAKMTANLLKTWAKQRAMADSPEFAQKLMDEVDEGLKATGMEVPAPQTDG